jgi:hypothetical protein
VWPPLSTHQCPPTEVKVTLIPPPGSGQKRSCSSKVMTAFRWQTFAAQAAIQVGTRDNGCRRSRGTRRRDASYLSSLGDEKRITPRGMSDWESHLVRSVAPRQMTFRSGRTAYRVPGPPRRPNRLRRSLQLRARRISFVQGRCFLSSRCTGAPFG